MCCSCWGHKESDVTERLNWTDASLVLGERGQLIISLELAWNLLKRENRADLWSYLGHHSKPPWWTISIPLPTFSTWLLCLPLHESSTPEVHPVVLSGLQDFVGRPGGRGHSCLVPHPQGKHSFITSVSMMPALSVCRCFLFLRKFPSIHVFWVFIINGLMSNAFYASISIIMWVFLPSLLIL